MSQLTIAIPTYRREAVLVETIARILALDGRPEEILVIDQTEDHDLDVMARLENWNATGAIVWVRLDKPSITAAMNRALVLSTADAVLFLDDDVIPAPELLLVHKRAHDRQTGVLVAGRVIQPWHVEDDPREGGLGVTNPASDGSWSAQTFIGCNFSVDRRAALEIGGFDENFVRVAYDYEKEFSHRWTSAGHAIVFEPAASLRHLKSEGGGTRSYGLHLTTVRPDHAVGAYYCIFRTWSGADSARRLMRRLFGSVVTRHHLRRPWWIPVTLAAELSGLCWALWLARHGSRTMGAMAR